MIVVTGATGKIGSALLADLLAHDVGAVRGVSRGATSFPAGVEAVSADLTRETDLRPALTGARSLFLLQGMAPEAPILEAARRAGVEHVVLVSSITVQTHPHLPAAAVNRGVEELLKASDMAWTILRPTQFASNTLLWASSVRDHGEVRAPYPDIGLPAIHPADIAAVALAALLDPVHRGKIYPLTGPWRVTPRQQAAAIATAVERELSFVELTREQAHQELTPFFGAETAHAVLDLMGGDTNDELLAVRDTVTEVTGRPATPFAQWAKENAAAFA
jgi:uncharacterized protein YbjT (DUF2867 family)